MNYCWYYCKSVCSIIFWSMIDTVCPLISLL
jgi:hypothetical protein